MSSSTKASFDAICQLPLFYKKNRKSITKFIISAEQFKEEMFLLHLKGHPPQQTC